MRYEELQNQLARHAKELVADGTTIREDMAEEMRQEHETGIAAETDGELLRTAPEPRDPEEFADDGLPNGVATQRAILDEAIREAIKETGGTTE